MEDAEEIVNMLLENDNPEMVLDIFIPRELTEDEIEFIESYKFKVVFNAPKTVELLINVYSIYKLTDGSK